MTDSQHGKNVAKSQVEKCLVALRAELHFSYPKIRPVKLLWILRRHSLSTFPNSFLVSGRLTDLSRRGALANLIRYQRGRDGHVLFSRLFYETAYPDIADAGAPAWAHYQTRGRGEIRSPHPLIDVPFLQAALDEDQGMPAVEFGNPVDCFLNNPERWGVNPSPFVDCVGFVMSGLWDGLRAPLEQLVSEHLSGAWINHRLMMIDAEPAASAQQVQDSLDESSRFDLICAGILLFRNYPASRTSRSRRWLAVGPSELSGMGGGTYTVIPGFAVGSGPRVALLGKKRLLSPDSSMITTDQTCLSLEQGVAHSTTTLVIACAEMPHSELVSFLGSLDGAAVVAPFSLLQEQAILAILSSQTDSEILVLPWGQQSQITCAAITFVEGAEDDSTVESWAHDGATEFADVTIVLSYSQRARVREDIFVAEALRRGAALSLIVDEEYGDWMPILSSRKTVLVDIKTAEDLRAFIPGEKMRMLPAASSEFQK
ncbi:MAG: hypothetical protein JJE28_00350 [Actinomycetales bacterium]|nr:hypothetical protein [Actinomycetales bacterium]